MGHRNKLGAAALALAALAAAIPLLRGRTTHEDAPMVASRPDRLPPIEEMEEQEEGEEGERRREAWIEQMHRAPEGVDWKRVEQDNVRALISERNRIARRERSAPPGQWVERGSDNQAGSMYAVVRSTDGDAIVAGSSLGGVWRGDRDGSGWTPLGDGIYGGAHHVVVLPPDVAGGPDVMVTSPTWSPLVYRSADDGATWDPVTGLRGDTFGVRRMVADADGTVWLVGVSQARATVYRSTDAGATFDEVLDLGGVWGDLWVPRDGSSTDVYAIGRSTLYRSVDGGDSWSSSPGPATLDTARITASEATSPPRLYVGAGGYYGGYGGTLYRSDDGGETWSQRGSLGDYWEVLAASITDPNLLAYGGVDLYRSTNGGASFSRLNRWDEYYDDPLNKLHADMMAVTVAPDPGGETWYIGCHGGVYESTNGLGRVRNLSMQGLRVSQYYSVFTDSSDPTKVLAGAQDQGLQWAAAAPAVGEARFDFDQVISGDYGHIVSTDGTTERTFSVYPGVVLTFLDDGGAEPSVDWFSFPDDPGIAPWLPFLAPDPQGERDAFLFAAGHLYRGHRSGNRWVYDRYSEQSFATSFRGYLSALAFSPVDPDLAVGINNTGDVYRSVDRGVTWTAQGAGPEDNYYYGVAVLPGHRDADLWYLGGSGYGGPSVYRSTDGGQTFAPWDDGLPPTLVYTLAELWDGTGRVLAGTENAVYMRDPRDPSGEWVAVTGTSAPVTRYWNAETLRDENTVRFATYGRGLWDFRLDPQGEGCFATQDADEDGVLCEDDCIDDDPESFPGAPERCDGLDNDCDGLAEPDDDGDGAWRCDGIPGADPAVVDCDDSQPLAAPGLAEIDCDGIDNDCDGAEVCPEPTAPDGPGGEDKDQAGGGDCGCDTPAGPAPIGVLALLAATVAARRRRSRTAG